jgi:hypothetical protein
VNAEAKKYRSRIRNFDSTIGRTASRKRDRKWRSARTTKAVFRRSEYNAPKMAPMSRTVWCRPGAGPQ